MPQLLAAPTFVSAEVGLIDAYTIDALFTLALNESKIPDAADLPLTTTGADLHTFDRTISGTHLYIKTKSTESEINPIPNTYETPAFINPTKYYYFGTMDRNPITGLYVSLSRYGFGETYDGSNISLHTSLDGTTWAYHSTIISSAFDNRLAAGGYDSNGRLHVFWNVLDTPSTWKFSRYIYSDDDGETWSIIQELITVSATNIDGFLNRIVELSDGSLIQPAHFLRGSTWSIGYYKCTNPTALTPTWNKVDIIVTGTLTYAEGTIVNLGNNELLFLCRILSGTCYRQFYSNDNGSIWSDQGNTTFDTWSVTTNRERPPFLTKINYYGNTIIACYYINTSNQKLNVVYGNATDFGTFGVSAWNATTLFEIKQTDAFDAGNTYTKNGYQSILHTNNQWAGIGQVYLAYKPDVNVNYLEFFHTPHSNRETVLTALGLTVSREVTAGEVIAIQYIKNALESKQLQGLSGARVAAFIESVTNNVSGAQIPVLQSIVCTDGYNIIDTYDIALDETSTPATSAYSIPGHTITLVVVSGMTVTKTVTERIYWGDSDTQAYTVPGTNMIKSLSGGEAASYTATAITNNVALDSATADLIAVGRYTDAPTDALKALINRTIVDYKAAGLFAKRDSFYIRGVHEALLSSQNWIKNSHNSTYVNSPTHIPKQGIQGDGATSYINNNYTPATQAVTLQLASACVSVMMKTLGTTTGRAILGALKSAGGARYLYIGFKTAANEDCWLNSGTLNSNVNVLVNEYLSYTRTGTTVQGHINGVVSGAAVTATAQVSLTPLTIMELAYTLDNGNPSSFNNGIISFSAYGGYLTPAELVQEYNIVKYFYDNVGGTF